MRRYLALGFAAAALASGCSNETPQFHAEDNPQYLSDWGMLSVDRGLTLSERVAPYDLNTPLFTDYAHKLRTVWMPDGVSASYRTGAALDFPVGTVLTKTFYYPKDNAGATFEGRVLKTPDESGRIAAILTDLDQVRLVETRLLIHRADGWEAAAYVWNDEQTDAALTRIGDTQQMVLVEPSGEGGAAQETEFTYVVPDVNQCAGCHAPNNTTRAISPIGPKARHLNKAFVHNGASVNQLSHLQSIGYLVGAGDVDDAPRNADWRDASASLNERARSYLDINCAHCHNAVGPADTSGLLLAPDEPLGPKSGLCKLPIAAGAGTGGRRFSIVPGAPDASIFVYRLESVEPDKMMPELGRSLSHAEGVALIRDWILSMDGNC